MTENQNRKKKMSFFRKQRNTIVALAIMFAVLLGGYFAVRSALSEDEPVETEAPEVELLPGEAIRSGATLIYPYIDRKNLTEIKVHNPANAARGEQYVDWGITFAYDQTADDYYGYLTGYDYAALDEMQLTYLVAGVCNPVFTSRIEDGCENLADFAPYGLNYASDEEATYLELKLKDGTSHKLYFGKKNPNGTGYYVRSMDTVTDDSGNTYVRNAVYLMNTATSSYLEGSALSLPTAMLNKLITYPIASKFSSFALYSTDETLMVSFLPLEGVDTADKLFGGSSIYYSVVPAGYFSSSAFETRITRFEDFTGVEVMEYATKQVTDVDEDGKEYTYFMFENETLAKYGLDPDHVQYILMYTALNEESGEHLASEVYFSKLRSDGYYYAYSMNFNTVVKVDPSLVDFLGWETLDFFDAFALRMSIGYCDTLTMKGKIDGVVYEETFKSTVNEAYSVQSVYAENLGKDVSLTLYRTLFQELYTTVLWDHLPEDLDKDALMAGEPDLEVTIKTPTIYVNAVDSDGTVTGGVVNKLESVTRILRFYQYSNGRAMMTVEMIDKDGNSQGESGSFYVRASRLDKLIGDTKKVCDGISFSYHEKE